jgi:small subunit ribosomal protein S16
LGTYDPGYEPAKIHIDVAKADAWIKKGAHASETVRSLIDRARRVQA